MPELPEVESIRTQLERFVVGHKITSLKILNPRTFEGDEKDIVGATFKTIRRFGKVLVLDLDNETSLAIHVKMTGQLIYRGPNLVNPEPISKKVNGGVPGPHTLVIFNLDREGILYYNDFRRFGWIKVTKTEDLKSGNKLLAKMGPEPFKDLTPEYFEYILAKTKRAIKVVIMDQAKIAGVGNIYANDALWLAKIDPKRASNTLSADEQRELYKAIHDVLREGMKYGGSSENSFVTPDGREGEYQRHTLVYGETGKDCTRCGTKITKFFLSGRGTFVCENCQK